MWHRLFSGPWPESKNLLPPDVQEQAERLIRNYWRTRGWQLIVGEIALWAVTVYQQIPYTAVYGFLAGMITLGYVLGSLPGFTMPWLVVASTIFLVRGMLICGLGAVTALSFLMPYTFASMLLSGRNRVFIQVCCTIAFWVSLIYDVAPLFPVLHPPDHILVGYNILLAAFTFQTLRFLNQLAIEINTAYVADEVQRRSQQFLARVSHELRTPLGSVLGFAKLLRHSDLTDTQNEYLDHIIDEGQQLDRLVGDLLDSAHLATGKVTLRLEPCDVNALCQTVADEHRVQLPVSVTMTLDLQPNLEPVAADVVRLRQAIGNLVANAVKYTEAGAITLRTYRQNDRACIQVADTGIGIPAEQQQIIFTPFIQLDDRRIGAGLGLDIARQIIRLHQGDITLVSAPDRGSTFTIELPRDGS